NPILQGGENVTINFNLDYINIPLLAKFYPTPEFNLFLGPQAGFLVSANEKVMTGEYENSKNDLSEILRDMDFGLLGGIGYDFDFGITLQAHYYLGLININKVRYVLEDGTFSHPKLKNDGFQLSVGYWF
ncbi:MAG TPA: porin family protein, partial [Flavobacteriaceae bacterium]|nr:porin family protein [Flavobacteriaceae bacterium]